MGGRVLSEVCPPSSLHDFLFMVTVLCRRGLEMAFEEPATIAGCSLYSEFDEVGIYLLRSGRKQKQTYTKTTTKTIPTTKTPGRENTRRERDGERERDFLQRIQCVYLVVSNGSVQSACHTYVFFNVAPIPELNWSIDPPHVGSSVLHPSQNSWSIASHQKCGICDVSHYGSESDG